jgi:hypothetical protein
MERGPLQDPRIRSLLAEKFVELWLHTDGKVKGAEFLALEQRYLGINASPYWMIVDPQNLELQRQQQYTMDPEEFLAFLRGEEKKTTKGK